MSELPPITIETRPAPRRASEFFALRSQLGQTVLGPAAPAAGYRGGARGGVLLVDGVSGWDRDLKVHFTPRTLFLGLQKRAFTGDRSVNAQPDGTIPGTMIVRLEALHHGGVRVRDFDVCAYQQIHIQIESWDDIRVRVLESSAVNFDAIAVVTPETTVQTLLSPLFLQTRDVAAGSFIVPMGAIKMTPRDDDPDFAWFGYAGFGVETATETPQFAGVEADVLACGYTTSFPGFVASWRIEL